MNFVKRAGEKKSDFFVFYGKKNPFFMEETETQMPVGILCLCLTPVL